MQFQPKESHVAIDFDNSQTKLKDLMRKEQYYLEEIESLKTRLNAKHPSQREKVAIIDMKGTEAEAVRYGVAAPRVGGEY